MGKNPYKVGYEFGNLVIYRLRNKGSSSCSLKFDWLDKYDKLTLKY